MYSWLCVAVLEALLLKIRLVATMVLIVLLGGCGPMVARLIVAEEDEPRFNALLAEPAAVRDFLADTTIKSWDDDYGTQIEYHSADGRVWLVFPGNFRSVEGFWKIRGPAGNPRLCYRYPGSRDAITGDPGDEWDCGPAALRLTDDEIVDGDVLQLRRRGQARYPRPLPQEIDVSITEVREEIGLGPLRQPNKTFREPG
jgi:hypothetical protein